jgi:hypothetical protein
VSMASPCELIYVEVTTANLARVEAERNDRKNLLWQQGPRSDC